MWIARIFQGSRRAYCRTSAFTGIINLVPQTPDSHFDRHASDPPPPRYYPTVEPIRAAQKIIHGRKMGAQFGIGACPPVSVLHLRSRHIHHRPLRKVLPLVARLFCPDSGQDCRISSTMATGAPIRNLGIPPQNVTIAVTIRCVSVRFYAP